MVAGARCTYILAATMAAVSVLPARRQRVFAMPAARTQSALEQRCMEGSAVGVSRGGRHALCAQPCASQRVTTPCRSRRYAQQRAGNRVCVRQDQVMPFIRTCGAQREEAEVTANAATVCGLNEL